MTEQDYSISVSIDVKDLEKLAKLLNAQPAFKEGIKMGAAEVEDYIRDYPPITYGNLPGPYPKRWYERGFGSYWAKQDGSVGYKKTSKTLGKQWNIRFVDDEMGAVVGISQNVVPYARYVQDEERQTQAHKRHGWRTIQMAAREKLERVSTIIRDVIEVYWLKNGAKR